ncbi:MAG: STAS/SEC14 domain-containing protein [Pseudomonadota bacterium]
MFKVTKVAPNRIDLELGGSLDQEAMRKGLDDLIKQSEGISEGLMLYTITDFAMPSAAAISVEFGRLPELFSMVNKFDRCAVLSEVSWLRSAAEIKGMLIPGLEIKAFELNERDAAEAWLSDTSAK